MPQNHRIEEDLEPFERVCLAILVQARAEWKEARRRGYITNRGKVRRRKLRFQPGRGDWRTRKLKGSWNTPTTPRDLDRLGKFWTGDEAQRVMAQLPLTRFNPDDLLGLLDCER